jgi:hypothetical protein
MMQMVRNSFLKNDVKVMQTCFKEIKESNNLSYNTS